MDSQEVAAQRAWQPDRVANLGGDNLAKELVGYATLAPSSHNTQCWKFAIAADHPSITILPDLACRCPAVDAVLV